MAGPSGVAGAGAGVLGRDLDLSLAPAADDGPRSPSPSHVFTHPPEDLKKKKKKTHTLIMDGVPISDDRYWYRYWYGTGT